MIFRRKAPKVELTDEQYREWADRMEEATKSMVKRYLLPDVRPFITNEVVPYIHAEVCDVFDEYLVTGKLNKQIEFHRRCREADAARP